MQTVMRPLLIDDDTKACIRELIRFADKHRLSLEEMKARAAAFERGEPVGPPITHQIEIPEGYSVYLTIEEHPMGPVRHLSVGIRTDDPEKRPNTEAVKMLMEEFGFNNPMEQTLNTLEPSPSGGLAFNVVEPLEGTVESYLGVIDTRGART